MIGDDIFLEILNADEDLCRDWIALARGNYQLGERLQKAQAAAARLQEHLRARGINDDVRLTKFIRKLEQLASSPERID